MIALCSKTYILRQEGGKCKFSSKGINKNALTSPFEIFKNVLEKGIPHTAINQGFRPRADTIYTYEQQRAGISFLYCKRQVLADGVHTEPLDVTLCPWPMIDYEIVDDHHPWSLTKKQNIIVGDKSYTSLRELLEASTEEDIPEDLLRPGIARLENHKVKGPLLVCLTKELVSENRNFWRRDTYWTTGLSPRASPLRHPHPGQNVLGRLLFEVKVAPLIDHDYI